MLRLRIFFISCQWPSDTTTVGSETLIVRLTGPDQATRVISLGSFPTNDEITPLTRISHVAAGSIALGIATSAQGPLIGVHTLDMPEHTDGRFERRTLTFTSRGIVCYSRCIDMFS